VNDGWRTCGYAAEIMAVVIERASFFDLEAPIQRVCTRDVPMPVTPGLQKAVMVSEEDNNHSLSGNPCGLKSEARQNIIQNVSGGLSMQALVKTGKRDRRLGG